MIFERVLRPLGAWDLEDAIALYHDLTGDAAATADNAALLQFNRILDHPGTTIWGVECMRHIQAMCTLHILPNMTRGARPYALIENVVTAKAQRRLGLGRDVVKGAIDSAWAANCYKVMILSGSTSGAPFYESIGFERDIKTGFVMRAPGRDLAQTE